MKFSVLDARRQTQTIIIATSPLVLWKGKQFLFQ